MAGLPGPDEKPEESVRTVCGPPCSRCLRFGYTYERRNMNCPDCGREVGMSSRHRLSPGQWHKIIPHSLIWRTVAYRLQLDVSGQAGNKSVQKAAFRLFCQRDILFYINTFVWQFNPKKKKGGRQIGLFITRDYQDDRLACPAGDVGRRSRTGRRKASSGASSMTGRR